METARQIKIWENNKDSFKFYGTAKNYEFFMANILFKMEEKGLLNSLRVANIVRIKKNRHSTLDIIDVIRHPNDWMINEVRPLPKEDITKIETKQEKVKHASEIAGMN